MAFKIYTKTGDKGMTSLFGGKRLPKNHLRIEAYGTVDELNSHLGLVRDQLPDEALRSIVKTIQDNLFTLGSRLASDPEKEIKLPEINVADIELLEQQIDSMNEDLPELKNFILPGGHPLVSSCHIARCVCRRAERLVVALNIDDPQADFLIVQYLNRLSDYLFVLARKAGQLVKAEEIIWNPKS